MEFHRPSEGFVLRHSPTLKSKALRSCGTYLNQHFAEGNPFSIFIFASFDYFSFSLFLERGEEECTNILTSLVYRGVNIITWEIFDGKIA